MLLSLSLLYGAKVEFEVLGSGGPKLAERASTSYLMKPTKIAKIAHISHIK